MSWNPSFHDVHGFLLACRRLHACMGDNVILIGAPRTRESQTEPPCLIDWGASLASALEELGGFAGRLSIELGWPEGSPETLRAVIDDIHHALKRLGEAADYAAEEVLKLRPVGLLDEEELDHGEA